MVDNHYRWDFIGLSTDEKPTPETSEKVANGSTFYCSDNSKLYVWYKTQWYEKVVEGGGGGTSYTAGDGINISNNEISVDTTTIQPKLTAGTNITIDANNVISAEGGGGATVVQDIGTSTTDVMSQKAVTDELFYNNSKGKVQIGASADSNSGGNAASIAIGTGSKAKSNNTIAIGTRASSLTSDAICLGRDSSSSTLSYNSVAIGRQSSATGESSVAVGANATATQKGQFDISTGTADWGYNNSGYRLLTGLYDGQSAHDAVTVEQVNATIDAINTALSTSIPHIGA